MTVVAKAKSIHHENETSTRQQQDINEVCHRMAESSIRCSSIGQEGEKDAIPAIKPPASRLLSDSISNNDVVTGDSKNGRNNPIIICDAWFGFPSQIRPRNERIRAVSRQLFNFLSWQRQHQQQHESPSSSMATLTVVGDTKDVEAIQNRLDQLLPAEASEKEERPRIQFRPNVAVEQVRNEVFLSQGSNGKTPSRNNNEHEGVSNCFNDEDDNYKDEKKSNHHLDTDSEALKAENDTGKDGKDSSLSNDKDTTCFCYLSPDAPQALCVHEKPPRVVVVGMLVDRKVRQDRSWKRAAQVLHVPAAQLPLDELGLDVLANREPLNIDTVLQLMQEWWWVSSSQTDTPQNHFQLAAMSAMAAHESRHPNRTIHLSHEEKPNNE